MKRFWKSIPKMKEKQSAFCVIYVTMLKCVTQGTRLLKHLAELTLWQTLQVEQLLECVMLIERNTPNFPMCRLIFMIGELM